MEGEEGLGNMEKKKGDGRPREGGSLGMGEGRKEMPAPPDLATQCHYTGRYTQRSGLAMGIFFGNNCLLHKDLLSLERIFCLKKEVGSIGPKGKSKGHGVHFYC